MTPAEATKLLGLTDAESVVVRSIRAAWARKVRAAHPDTGDDNDNAWLRLERFNQARDLLLAAAAEQSNTCTQCRGTGRIGIKGRLGSTKCPSCAGTGDKFR